LLGQRRQHFHATEVVDSDKEEILRAYLRRWTWEVGQFFSGVGPESPSADLDRIAPDHPVFRIDVNSTRPSGAAAHLTSRDDFFLVLLLGRGAE
jgi:hypothetical protein